MAEEFVRPVDEVDLHGFRVYAGPSIRGTSGLITALSLLLPLLGLVVAPMDEDFDLDAWGFTALEQDLSLALDRHLGSTSLLDVECAATLCRIDADHPDVASADAFLAAIQEFDGFTDADMHYSRFTDEDGAVFTAAWVGRPGASLLAGHPG
jgi:hypothetical protein